jgi:bifunctional ADP-heptose synthase (sugar kinase/adenylyltransferase)
LRVDREPGQPPSEKSREKLAAKLDAKLKSADGMAISDYGFGVVSPSAVAKAMRSMKTKSVTTLDARYKLDDYSGCGITAATPNEAGWKRFIVQTSGATSMNLGVVVARRSRKWLWSLC